MRCIHNGGVLALLLLVLSSAALGKPEGSRTREVEAAFLVQFCKYITWPATAFTSPSAPLIVGVVGRDPFGSVLDDIARKVSIGGRAVEVRRFQRIPNSVSPHLLYIAPEAMEHLKQHINQVATRPIALVGKHPQFLNYGTINFVMLNNKIRFDISRKNSQKSGLKISSKLLKVANAIE